MHGRELYSIRKRQKEEETVILMCDIAQKGEL